ncbi:phosphatase PAP2 family protein [Nocardiopsis composta]|uniref:Undecaprenyl-diphosphatase n=1 Tax=Nocardiopsis composta TaxID=157465 RepID=A0A7W8QQH1_9ACTN|nr:phosphatase PAP2 family protein [Nocardiopsis composta]MBB5434614.1 undecaprenyl-diphosphatase [Nocardiopsis composta]
MANGFPTTAPVAGGGNKQVPPYMILISIAAAIAFALLSLLAYPAREELFTKTVDWVADSGSGPIVGFIADKGLLVLVAAAGALAVRFLFRSIRRFRVLVAAGAGVITAYALSEVIKLLVAEARPCSSIDVASVLSCPGAGDWSWPSNHSVLAAAFATACMLTAARTTWFTAPIALVIAGSRVAAGVHYVHDVLSGLALGTLVVTLTVVSLRPLLDRVLTHGKVFGRLGAAGGRYGGGDD